MTGTLPFDGDLLERVLAAVNPGDMITTLGIARPNWIISVDLEGVKVETERSKGSGAGPQLVPAWMVTKAWDHLRRYGRLSQTELLGLLNVKRSAFVCALLARFPEVDIESTRPIVLRLAQPRQG